MVSRFLLEVQRRIVPNVEESYVLNKDSGIFQSEELFLLEGVDFQQQLICDSCEYSEFVKHYSDLNKLLCVHQGRKRRIC